MISAAWKFLSILGRFGGLFSWLSAVGSLFGPLGALAGALLGFIPRFIGWLFADLADAFRSPEKFIVRTVFGLVCLGVGLWQGIAWDAHKVIAANAKVTELTQAWKAADDANKKLADEASRARDAAEAAARAAPDAPVPVSGSPAKRLRPAATKASAKGESGLFGLPKIHWGFK